MGADLRESAAKVPAITAGFWLIKVLCTTLGETAGDTVSMTWLGETTAEAGRGGLNGYVVGSLLFGGALAVLVALQIRARRFSPWLYWAAIIASTTFGTTLADYSTRSLGLGYAGGSALLAGLVLTSLALWRARLGSISIATVHRPEVELFYWLTITLSQTLGTALGDWAADGVLGYAGGALVFAAALGAVGAAAAFTRADRVVLFWIAFVLTRPFGATLGDLLDKPAGQGGFEVSRPVASLALLGIVAALIWLIPQRPAAARA